MNNRYKLGVLVVIMGTVLYLIINNTKQNHHHTAGHPQTSSKSLIKQTDNTYKDLRNLAFAATMDQIGIELPQDTTSIYGVIMDWGLPEGTATLVAFLDGEASLYLSSGGGVIGADGQGKVKKAAITFVKDAEKYLNNTVKTSNTLIKIKDGVKFYFLTNKGIYSGEEKIENFDKNTSPWSSLFEQANQLITAIRTIPAVEHSH